ncbi:hypothetical protein [Hyphomicrobium sp.]|uniref:hypothetical protein n=1 Tax=Hyphomicrobium sp. TaxID=82 RepID=UPI0025BC180A|nr:hypothetical protein [Hyphomicrobium sp.]MCC7252714.1 hypothetical protein [Hyphomicrobium sp.]
MLRHRSADSGVSSCISRVLAALAIGGALSIGLAGCGDEAPVSGERHQAQSDEGAPHKVKWLEISSQITPAQWLVSRGEDKPRPVSDPEVQRIAELLTTAHRRYRESERMIANRSVQVEDMLKQIGLAEDAQDVLEGLTRIGGEVGQAEGFGSISQYYFNLRAASVSRADALATLKARYGSKS